MLSIELSKTLEERLENLVSKTGRTKDYYLQKAILELLEDLEDYNLAVELSQNIEETYPLSEIEAKYGLAD